MCKNPRGIILANRSAFSCGKDTQEMIFIFRKFRLQ